VFIHPHRDALQVGLALAQCVQRLQDLCGRLRAAAGRLCQPLAYTLQGGGEALAAEGFDQVVIRPGVKPCDAIVQGIACGENQHRQAVASRAKPPQQFNAVQAWEAQVQYQHVECFMLQGVQATDAVLQPVQGIALLAQTIADAFTQRAIVLNQQQAQV